MHEFAQKPPSCKMSELHPSKVTGKGREKKNLQKSASCIFRVGNLEIIFFGLKLVNVLECKIEHLMLQEEEILRFWCKTHMLDMQQETQHRQKIKTLTMTFNNCEITMGYICTFFSFFGEVFDSACVCFISCTSVLSTTSPPSTWSACFLTLSSSTRCSGCDAIASFFYCKFV